MSTHLRRYPARAGGDAGGRALTWCGVMAAPAAVVADPDAGGRALCRACFAAWCGGLVAAFLAQRTNRRAAA